nr:tetratricopeptide repeat protein [uncultured Fusobacterium sp.]
MKIKIVIVMAVSFFISACVNTKNKNYDFIKGLNEYQKSDKVSALENYKKAYEKDNKNVVLLNEMAYLYLDLGNYDEAKRYYVEALEVSPHNENALQNLLQLFYEEKNIQELKKYSENILDKNSFLYYLTNIRLAILENDEDKIDNFFQRMDINPKFLNNLENYKDIFDRYSLFLITNKRYDEAEKNLLKYIVNNSDNKEELEILKKVYQKENNKEKLNNLNKILQKR